MADLAQIRTVFALEKMPTSLRSDALADGSIVARFGIPVHSPVRIADKIVNRPELFSRFREAADGKAPAPLVDLSGAEVNARIELDEDGDGSVQIGKTNVRFPQAALLASDPTRRRAWVDRMLARFTLTAQHEKELLALTAQPVLPEKDFIHAVDLLSTAPESFASLFKEKLERARGNIGEADLLPDDPRYWEDLTAKADGSPDLPAFIAAELSAERRRQLDVCPLRAYRTISLSFCAPALVPKELLDELPIDSVVAMMEEILKFDDPFALVGSFEYCAGSMPRDARFVTLGEKFLLRLVTDMDWLRRAAAMWATGFVIATARLAMDDRTRRRPVYWRRLAAASHASLVVRTCGVHDIDPSDILRWAIQMRGLEYHCSILSDMAVEPRWRPEWADPDILTADIFSRAYGAFHRIPKDVAPATWGDHLSKGMEWIQREKVTLFLTAPAVLEGGLRRAAPPLAEMGAPLTEIFQRFIDAPDLENLIAAGGASQRYGVPAEIVPSVVEALARIRKGTRNLDDTLLRPTMAICAHLALLTSNAALADAVVQTVLACARGINRREAVNEAAFRVIEASGAITDPTAQQALLCQGLLALSNILPPNQLLEDLEQLLDALRQVNPQLAAPLGQAIHTARLGAPSSLL